MRRAVTVLGIAAVVCLTVACGGATTVTEKRILEWGPILNLYMGSNFADANAFPKSFDDVFEWRPDLADELKTTDGWGNDLLYRQLRVDLYNIISAGPDGDFGNDDDIVLQNGALFPPAEVYGKWPLKR